VHFSPIEAKKPPPEAENHPPEAEKRHPEVKKRPKVEPTPSFGHPSGGNEPTPTPPAEGMNTNMQKMKTSDQK
jgi:hypothetical protein